MNSITISNSKEIVSRLQRGVLRLALSFHGTHPGLDKQLKELGTLIRNGKKDEELQCLIDEIVNTIVSQGINQNTDQRGGRTLCDLLGRIESKFPESHALEQVQQELSLPLNKAGLEQALDRAADAVAGLVNTKSAEGADACDGLLVSQLLERIEFSTSAAQEIDEIKNLIKQRQDEVQLMRNLNRAASLISKELSATADPDAFSSSREHLLLLMNLTPFPANCAAQASETRRSIENADSIAVLRECVPRIAELTAVIRNQLQEQIDGLAQFLKVTLQKLRLLESQIQQSNNFHNESVENAFNLEKNLGDQGHEVRAEIEEERDIDSIKATVISHLDSIGASLGEFVHVEDSRHQSAREKIGHMVRSINQLKFEANELRDNLEKQHNQILIDPLTGILNRAGYDENINKEYRRWKRYDSDLSVAVIDLDLFKDINDSYGHAAGDKVLATVSRQIETQIRESDVLCRYGGEEFVLLLPETNVGDGMAMLEKLRSYIANCNFHFHKTRVPVTLSCGVAEFHDNDDAEKVFNRADQAMYLAKRAGRNRCRSENDLREESA
ncbi:MAG: diguanylate cyclase (GGDEF)-like protein [Gammaproteobacteria bacterium]|jgi:diguanylate cyclase (GGDEF)-like protein